MRRACLTVVTALSSTLGAPAAAQPPQGAAAAPASRPEFQARGHEPGWDLRIDGGQLTLVMDYGATTLRIRRPEPQKIDRGERYAGNADGQVLIVTVLDRVCEDEATGIPHPKTVEITLDEQPLRGCGGDPAVLLQGGRWVVDELVGAAPADGTSISFTFGENGRISGAASCNQMNGNYAVGGEGLVISELVTTRRACPAPVMEQEQAVLTLLQGVRGFRLTPNGFLVLEAMDGRRLRAKRGNE